VSNIKKIAGTIKGGKGDEPVAKFAFEGRNSQLPGVVTGKLTVSSMDDALLAQVIFSENRIQTQIGDKVEDHTTVLKGAGLPLADYLSGLSNSVAQNRDNSRLMRRELLKGIGIEAKEEPGPARMAPEARAVPVKSADNYFRNQHEPRRDEAGVRKGSRVAKLDAPPTRTL
jgi:hypothetical protein